MDYKTYAEKIHSVLHTENSDVDWDPLGEIYKIDAELYEDRLELCPFCGSEPQIITVDSGIALGMNTLTGVILNFYDLRCTNLACFLYRGANWQITNKAELVRKWNNRQKPLF
jgi:hypothetical protein